MQIQEAEGTRTNTIILVINLISKGSAHMFVNVSTCRDVRPIFNYKGLGAVYG